MGTVPMQPGMQVRTATTADLNTNGRGDVIIGDVNEVIAGVSAYAVGGAFLESVVGVYATIIAGYDLNITYAGGFNWNLASSYNYYKSRYTLSAVGNYNVGSSTGTASVLAFETLVLRCWYGPAILYGTAANIAGSESTTVAGATVQIGVSDYAVATNTFSPFANELYLETGLVQLNSSGEMVLAAIETAEIASPVVSLTCAVNGAPGLFKVSAAVAQINGDNIQLGQPPVPAAAMPPPPPQPQEPIIFDADELEEVFGISGIDE
jgi:hypothetical protein